MRLAHAIRRRFVVAVESQTVERTPVELVELGTQAGARWGRPASFDQASRPRPSSETVGFTVDWIDTYRVFKGTETHREYSRVAAGETDPEGIRSVTFYCGSRKERRNVRGVIFTNLIQDYVKFNFPVLAFSGARGEPHPPPTPEEDADA
jgi:hypothetical protein